MATQPWNIPQDPKQTAPGGYTPGTTMGDLFDPGIFADLFGEGGEDDRKERMQRKRAKRQRERNIEHSFLIMLQDMGINSSPNVAQLVAEAVKKKYSGDTFLYYLRQTPEYAQRFRGKPDDMGEAEYFQEEKAFKAIAAQAGLNLNNNTIAWMFRNEVTSSEFAIKAPAVARLQRHKELFRQFGAELVQGGVAKPGEVSRKELLKFAAGLGNKKWADLWQDTISRTAAMEAGIEIKRQVGSEKSRTSISQKELERLSGMGMSEEEMQAGFENLAEHILTTLPMSKIHGLGLSKKQLVRGQFGGKNQAEIRQKMLRIVRTEEAFQEAPRSTPEFKPAAEQQTRGARGESRPQTL